MRRSLAMLKSSVAAVADPKKILIVGGGPTAALTAASLKERLDGAATVTILDKARGLGGRMSTHRANGAGAGAYADSGAQYLTELSPRSAAWFDRLRKAGVIVPLQGEMAGQHLGQKSLRNYVAPSGISAVVKHIAAQSGATFVPSYRLVALDVADAPEPPAAKGAAVRDPRADGPRRQWVAHVERVTAESAAAAAAVKSKGVGKSAPAEDAASRTEKRYFDAVVLTCPAPQLLEVQGDLPALLEGAGVVEGLKGVTYSSRYSLILYFGPGDWPAVLRALPFVGKYCDKRESDVVRFVSFDSLKRGQVPPEFAAEGRGGSDAPDSASATLAAAAGAGSSSGGGGETCPAVIVHTSVEFGRMYVDTDPALVEPVILEHLRRLFPSLPEPVETRCHRWRYSQVMQGYKGPQPFGEDIEGSEPLRGSLRDSHAAVAPVAQVASAGGPAAASTGSTALAHSPPDGTAGAILTVDEPPLVLAGDAFTASHFDGCVASAERVSALLR